MLVEKLFAMWYKMLLRIILKIVQCDHIYHSQTDAWVECLLSKTDFKFENFHLIVSELSFGYNHFRLFPNSRIYVRKSESEQVKMSKNAPFLKPLDVAISNDLIAFIIETDSQKQIDPHVSIRDLADSAISLRYHFKENNLAMSSNDQKLISVFDLKFAIPIECFIYKGSTESFDESFKIHISKVLLRYFKKASELVFVLYLTNVGIIITRHLLLEYLRVWINAG